MVYICGIPGSRTAWFSVFLTANGVPCIHEPQNHCRTMDEYLGRINSYSESGTGLYFTRSHEVYRDRKILFIRQSGDKFDRTKGEYPLADETQEYLYSIAGMTVDYEDIDSRLPEICEFLGVDMKYDLTDMVIKTKQVQCEESARSLISDASKFHKAKYQL